MRARAHEPEDMRMQGQKQASTHNHKDIKMREYKDINKSNISNIYITHIHYFQVTFRLLQLQFTSHRPIYSICLMVYLIIFWCTIHQTSPYLHLSLSSAAKFDCWYSGFFGNSVTSFFDNQDGYEYKGVYIYQQIYQ